MGRIAGLISLLGLIAATAFSGAPQTIIWKPLPQAILLLDDKPPKTWNAYKAEKHDNWVLLLLWRRYLLVDLREEAVYDLDPQKLKHSGDSLECSEADKPAEPIVISNWDSRDVGLMRRIRFQFGKNGSVLEIQVPEKPDLRPFYIRSR